MLIIIIDKVRESYPTQKNDVVETGKTKNNMIEKIAFFLLSFLNTKYIYKKKFFLLLNVFAYIR